MNTHRPFGGVPFDLLAVGCGPFNMSVLALASQVKGLRVAALERNAEFRWHPGLLFEDAKLQLSFLADLVTLVEPSHPLSFLRYLKAEKRIYPFFIRERFHPTRREYEDYLHWVLSQLDNAHFGQAVEQIEWDSARRVFSATVRDAGGIYQLEARHVLVGIGTRGETPASLRNVPASHLCHSSEYLHRQDAVRRARHVTVLGSGQSGGEVFLDLLRRESELGARIAWLTRTRSFAPLDYTKLVLEMTTPDYVRYFHALDESVRDRLVGEQWQHYKGLSSETIEEIYEVLYARRVARMPPVELRMGTAVESARMQGDRVVLSCRHRDSLESFEHTTDLVIAATGYKERKAAFLEPLLPNVVRDKAGRFKIRLDYSLAMSQPLAGQVFVANAEMHTHGVATPDLGTCAVRSATILNTVLGQVRFELPSQTAFSTFAPPPSLAL